MVNAIKTSEDNDVIIDMVQTDGTGQQRYDDRLGSNSNNSSSSSGSGSGSSSSSCSSGSGVGGGGDKDDDHDSCSETETLTFGELLKYSIDCGPVGFKDEIKSYIDKLSSDETMIQPIYSSGDVERLLNGFKTTLYNHLDAVTYVKFIFIEPCVYKHVFDTFNTLT